MLNGLVAKWNGDCSFATSKYFPQMYGSSDQTFKKGKAYVDDLSAEEIRQYRGTLTEPARKVITESVCRGKSQAFLKR